MRSITYAEMDAVLLAVGPPDGRPVGDRWWRAVSDFLREAYPDASINEIDSLRWQVLYYGRDIQR